MAQLNRLAKLKIVNYRYSLLLALEILGQLTKQPKKYWMDRILESGFGICQTLTPEQLEDEINNICEK